MKYVTSAAALLVLAAVIHLPRAAFGGDVEINKPAMKQSPVFQAIPDVQYKLGGELGRRAEACTVNWILPAPEKNPGMLDMFKDSVREHEPFASPEGWAGEFAGKYLTHAAQMYKLTHDEKLYRHIRDFVGRLVALQADDGYFGPWPKKIRWKPGPWDTWGHYHIMYGLITWYQESHDERALNCACRIADLLCKTFLNVDERKAGLMDCETPIHALCLLYEITGRRQYLDLALDIAKKFERGGDYVRLALAGREYFQGPAPRWESFHSVMAIPELYYITGDEKYKKAFEHIWWSLLKTDRHNNGGETTWEQAVGNPYQYGAIETCCTVAWMAMSVDMLRLTGDSRVADELEFSLLNSGLGMMSPDGSWVTYNTPADGVKLPSTVSIGWQSRQSTPQLSCCSVNGPRAIAMTCEWALMSSGDGLVLNYYGPGEMSAKTASGNEVSFVEQTEYPADGKIDITVNPAKPEEFTLSLRIPYWSAKTSVSVNGQAVAAKPGEYLKLNRQWTAGDRIAVELDFRPHFWVYRPSITATHWNTKWTLFGPLVNFDDKQFAELDKQVAEAKEIPAEMTYTSDEADDTDVMLDMGKETLKPKTAEAKDGHIDLVRAVSGENRKQFAYAFATYDSPADEKVRMTFNFSGDSTLFVNGQKAKIEGNGANPPNGRTLRADIQLHKGRNIIAFKIPWVHGVGWFLNTGWQRPTAPGVMETSIYRGPILMTFDPRFNDKNIDEKHLPAIPENCTLKLITDFNEQPKPMVLCEVETADGKKIRLCDFALAGATGTEYRSWLSVKFNPDDPNIKKDPMEFSKDNPLRSFRP